MSEAAPRTVVIGVGSELRRDDGVGVIAARVLGSEALPDGVTVVEGGTGGFDLLFELEGFDRAIIVDAADFGGEPGAVRTFTLEEAQLALACDIGSLHQIGLSDVLAIGELVGPMPDIHIVGVQPAEVAPGMGLTPSVGAALPAVIAQVRSLVTDPVRPAPERPA